MDVHGIHIIGASYLPTGIETFFPNLIGLSVEQHLKEIKQNDLEPFPQLKHLWLARNQLEVIEKDLFKFNTELVYISLRQNFIKEIDSNVFDNLKSLLILELDRNDCINDNAVGRNAVTRLIQQSKESCTARENTSTEATTSSIVTFTKLEEQLMNEKEMLNTKLLIWKSSCIVLVVLLLLVVIVGVLLKKFRNDRLNFVLFRNV